MYMHAEKGKQASSCLLVSVLACAYLRTLGAGIGPWPLRSIEAGPGPWLVTVWLELNCAHTAKALLS